MFAYVVAVLLIKFIVFLLCCNLTLSILIQSFLLMLSVHGVCIITQHVIERKTPCLIIYAASLNLTYKNQNWAGLLGSFRLMTWSIQFIVQHIYSIFNI